jgi:hypothetical protein
MFSRQFTRVERKRRLLRIFVDALLKKQEAALNRVNNSRLRYRPSRLSLAVEAGSPARGS